ncbi:MAG: oxygenase MpaB family protein [Alcanivorax sediminis]|uniref:oxygenase MpaB family protein n=1 Tax=Alcanivorax sediminis TaxID=2663008 RepID=UPI003C691371
MQTQTNNNVYKSSQPLKEAVTKELLQQQLEVMTQRVLDPEIGLYGPGSMAWKVHGNISVMFGAGAANLLQLAHPWVSQAIDQHSQTQTDPMGRLQRTFLNVHSMVFGNLDQVLESAVRVHNIHAKITGQVSESTGRTKKKTEYFANQVEALLWVHATLWIVALHVHELFYGAVTQAEREQYYDESKLFAFLFGIPEEAMPENWDAYVAWFNEVVDSDLLAVGKVGRELVDYLFTMRSWLIPLLNRHRIHTSVLLPQSLRAPFGMPEITPALQKKFDFDVRLIRTAMKFVPVHLRWIPSQIEARRRIKGKKTDLITRMTNKMVYGRPLLVS